MEALITYLEMDGYAVYIWPSYGIVALVLIGLAVWSVAGLRATKRQLDLLQPAVEARRRARHAASTGDGEKIAEESSQ